MQALVNYFIVPFKRDGPTFCARKQEPACRGFINFCGRRVLNGE